MITFSYSWSIAGQLRSHCWTLSKNLHEGLIAQWKFHRMIQSKTQKAAASLHLLFILRDYFTFSVVFTALTHSWHIQSDSILSFRQIQSQLNKALDDMSTSLCTLKEGMSYTKQLPSKGLSQSQVLDKIREYETLSKWAFIPQALPHVSLSLYPTSRKAFLIWCSATLKFAGGDLSFPSVFTAEFHYWFVCGPFIILKHFSFGLTDDLLLQMRWSGRKDVFRVQCTGEMKRWPNSWWRYASLYTSLDFGFPATNSQGRTWKHVAFRFIK